MEAGLAALKAASVEISVGQDDQITPVVEHSGTIVTVEDGKMVVSAIPPSGTLISETLVDERQYFSDSEVPCGSSMVRRRRHATVATQTHITSSDVDYIRSELRSSPPGEWYSNLSATECNNSTEESLASSAVPACSMTMGDSPPAAALDSAAPLVNGIAQSDQSSGSHDKNIPPRLTPEDCQFEMDLSDDEVGQGTPMLSRMSESSMFVRCASMPSISRQKGFDDSTDAWAASQYMSTALNDYTPTTRYACCIALDLLERYHCYDLWTLYLIFLNALCNLTAFPSLHGRQIKYRQCISGWI